MATLPADRSKLALAQNNQVPSAVASSTKNINAITELYDTTDKLYGYVNQTLQGIYDANKFTRLGILNATDPPFNAKGDGTTDDTAALAEWLTASAGSIAYLPPGTYLNSGTLPIVLGTKIVGAGSHNSIIKSTAAVPALKADGADDDGVYFWEISGIALDGNEVGTTGVELNYAHEGHMSYCRISEFEDGVRLDNSYSNDFSKNQIVNNANNNLELGSQSNDIVVDDCQLDGAGNYGAYITADSQGITFLGCIIQNCGKDGLLADAGRAIIINGGYFENNNKSNTSGCGDIHFSGSVAVIEGICVIGVQIWTKQTDAAILTDRVQGGFIGGTVINLLTPVTTPYTVKTTTNTLNVIIAGIFTELPYLDSGNALTRLTNPTFRGSGGVRGEFPTWTLDTTDSSKPPSYVLSVNGVVNTNMTLSVNDFFFQHLNTGTSTMENIWRVPANNSGMVMLKNLNMNQKILSQPVFDSFTTANRPSTPVLYQWGFDTTISKPIWWNGTVWKDYAGTTI